MPIPDEWRSRVPLMTEGAWRGLERILQHPQAPRYNRAIGDRVGEAELAGLARFREAIAEGGRESGRAPSPRMVAWVEALRDELMLFDELPLDVDVARDFEELPITWREDVVRRLEDLVPRTADLDEAIVYSTSGTTGHPVVIPHHPGAMVQNLAHLELLADLHGAHLEPAEGVPHVLNVTVQQNTYVFATTMSGWGGAVFTKINLSDHDWAGGPNACRRFVGDFAPQLLCVEPVTMAAMIERGLPIRPRMIVSSAVQLSAEHAAFIAAETGAAVVDLYSSTETGPIAATVPGVEGHVVLLPDVYVEALDDLGDRVPDGERGEIAVTGGRNPYLPLVRFRTGDHGRLTTITLPDGSRARVILDLEGRSPVRFRGNGGRDISSVDVARTIRPIGPFVQHAFLQHADGSVALRLRPIPGVPIPLEGMEQALRELFGKGTEVTVEEDATLGDAGGKVVPWRSELPSR